MRNRERWGLPAAAFAAFISALRSQLHIRIYGIYLRTHKSIDYDPPDLPLVSYRIFDQNNLNDLLELAKNPDLNLPETFIRKSMEKGDICAVTLLDDQIVSYGWSSFSMTHDTDQVYAMFPSKYRYGYNAFTLPEYRGMHLRDGTIPLRDKYCADRGCHASISYVAVDNFSSKRSASRLGIRRIGYVAFFKNGSRFLPWHSPGTIKAGLRFQFRPEESSAGI